MPRNSAGVFTLPAGNPVIPDTVIESVWANTTLEDVALALTQSLARSGVGGMLGQFKSIDGAEGLPGIGFLGELDTGFYLEAPGELRMTLSGQDLFRWYNGAVWVWRASTSTWERVLASNSISVDDQGNVTIDGDLLVTGDTNIGGNLTVDGNVDIGGDLTIGGDTVLNGNTTIDNLVVTGETNIGGAPSPTRAYRYWRMDMMEARDPVGVKLAEIELGLGELAVQTLSTLTAIPSIPPIPGLSALNDGGILTDTTFGPSGIQLIWDFGEGTPQPLTYLRQYPRFIGTMGGPVDGSLEAFRISASDDGVQWAVINGFSGLGADADEWSEKYYIFPQGGGGSGGGGGGGTIPMLEVAETIEVSSEAELLAAISYAESGQFYAWPNIFKILLTQDITITGNISTHGNIMLCSASLSELTSGGLDYGIELSSGGICCIDNLILTSIEVGVVDGTTLILGPGYENGTHPSSFIGWPNYYLYEHSRLIIDADYSGAFGEFIVAEGSVLEVSGGLTVRPADNRFALSLGQVGGYLDNPLVTINGPLFVDCRNFSTTVSGIVARNDCYGKVDIYGALEALNAGSLTSTAVEPGGCVFDIWGEIIGWTQDTPGGAAATRSKGVVTKK